MADREKIETCQSCGFLTYCVNLGLNAWICGECIAPLARQLEEDIDEKIFRELLEASDLLTGE
jgi:hypothetical protein